MAVDIKEIRDRVHEQNLIDTRGWRQESYDQWKKRLKKVDSLYRGDWAVLFPNDMAFEENPHVMNLVQVMLDDLARLVSEGDPSVVCPPAKDSKSAEEAAILRAAIANTYGDVNDWDLLTPRFTMDLAGAGAAFAVVTQDPNSEYPCWHRIDPRHAYPDVYNGQIQDLMTISTFKLRQIPMLYPKLAEEWKINPNSQDTAEVVGYYSKGECVQAVMHLDAGKVKRSEIVDRWKPDFMTVAFAQLDSYDGEFRGMFDQLAGSLQTKNRIVRLLLDYTDQLTYAPMVGKGVLNDQDPPAPGTMYRLDPNVQDAQLGRLQPAGSSPQLFGILEYLDREQRGGAAYPAARQGDVSQSIASASFVASTQGQLSSAVRNIQRLIGNMRQDLNGISFKFDEEYLNVEKALMFPVGNKKTYKPQRDIDGIYMNRVVYGAGAGIDRSAADIRVLQHVGAGIISKQTAREQTEYIRDANSEKERIEREASENVLLQKFLSDADLRTTMRVITLQEDGKSLSEAVAIIQKEDEANAAAQPPMPGPEGMPEMEGEAPPDAALQQQALEAGAVEQAPIQPFAPPPLTNVLVRS